MGMRLNLKNGGRRNESLVRAMKDVALQRVDRNTLKVFSEEDADAIADFPIHKLLRARISGALKPRSYEQLKLYHAACRAVAENTEDPNWNSKEKVDFQCKVKCRLIKEFVVVNGVTHIIPGSVSYSEMNHLEACNYIDRAIDEMAGFLGLGRDEFLSGVDQ